MITPSGDAQKTLNEKLEDLSATPGVINPVSLTSLHLSPLALLRITSSQVGSSGILLGLDDHAILDISHAFVIPKTQEPWGEYTTEMLELIKDGNVDNNMVGWFITVNSSEAGLSAVAPLSKESRDAVNTGGWWSGHILEKMARMQREVGDTCLFLVHGNVFFSFSFFPEINLMRWDRCE